MKFQFTEKKVSLPESVHAYAEKKVMKLERFFRDDAEANSLHTPIRKKECTFFGFVT